MNGRLNRIQALVLSLTTILAVSALAGGFTPPFGIILGGLAAWLDFVVIRGLASAMLARKPAKEHIVPMALAKSLILVTVPAVALFLPGALVSGVSFAIGVTTLPAAIVIDACLAIPQSEVGEV